MTEGEGSLMWGGRRASNSLPQPWEGCALPGELLPHQGEVYVSTTASACGAASATTERTSSEHSVTRRPDRAPSNVDAMMGYSGRSAPGTTRTQPPPPKTFPPSLTL